jgi:hypothetical protein
MIIINELILNKALKILKEKEQKKEDQRKLQEYIISCLEARICPICGEPLLEREPTEKEEKESLYDLISYVLYCEKSNFIHIEGYYDYEDEC